MENKKKNWNVLEKLKTKGIGRGDVLSILFKNRNINTLKEKNEFLNPKKPEEMGLEELGISENAVIKSIKRITEAIKKNEDIVIYGDYDADGICSTAILWETLYVYTKKVTPHIPDRFSEGYGINPSSIEKIKKEHPGVSLIITVDNGIVAFDAIEKASNLGIDVIITDHHQKEEKVPKAYSIVHTDKIAGSGVAWVFARELAKNLKKISEVQKNKLELAAIGTIADQLPLVGPNRSIAKFGLSDLAGTGRLGLKELYREASISNGFSTPKAIGTYEVNYVIAPRLNAMGRLRHALDSLRLLCTTDYKKASELADHVGSINKERQKIVDEVLVRAKSEAEESDVKTAIVVSGDYHEGVIGLAAGKLVEDFGRPAIVFSVGKEKSKASARSIPGFNIISEIKKLSSLLLGAGGHPMAAGLSIETKNIEEFKEKFQKNSLKLLTDELLTKTLKIDCELEFSQINLKLVEEIESFAPFGIGNPNPVFLTRNVTVVDSKVIGTTGKHLKMNLNKDGIVFGAIAFNFAKDYQLKVGNKLDLVYSVEENVWNGNSSLQLKIKDLNLT